VCQEHGIEHRLTTTNHPWTNGQVERMNRTLKEATVKKFSDQTPQHLKGHLHAFLMAYNFAKRLKPLGGLTPYEYICQCWQKEPKRFTLNPYHHTLGLNTLFIEGEILRGGGIGGQDPFVKAVHRLHEGHLDVQAGIPDGANIGAELGDDGLFPFIEGEQD
jgi:transposase InsO family protein